MASGHSAATIRWLPTPKLCLCFLMALNSYPLKPSLDTLVITHQHAQEFFELYFVIHIGHNGRVPVAS